jgi:hypothetical protein
MNKTEYKPLYLKARLTQDVNVNEKGFKHVTGNSRPKTGTEVWMCRFLPGRWRMYVPGTQDIFELSEPLTKKWLKAERGIDNKIQTLSSSEVQHLDFVDEIYSIKMNRY